MQLWLALGLAAFLAHAISATIDKHLMNIHYTPIITNSYKMLFDGSVLLIIGFLFFNLQLSWGVLGWAVLLGATYALQGVMYFMLLKRKDVEEVVPSLQSVAIALVFVASVVLFHDVTTIPNWIGLLFVIFGIYSVISPNGFAMPTFDKSLWLVGLCAILHMMYVLILKLVLNDFQPILVAVLMYFSAATFLFGFKTLSSQNMKAFHPEFKVWRILCSSLFGATATFLLYSALAIGEASKVYTLSGAHPVFVFIIASIFLKEKFSWHRLSGTIAVALGIFLVAT